MRNDLFYINQIFVLYKKLRSTNLGFFNESLCSKLNNKHMFLKFYKLIKLIKV